MSPTPTIYLCIENCFHWAFNFAVFKKKSIFQDTFSAAAANEKFALRCGRDCWHGSKPTLISQHSLLVAYIPSQPLDLIGQPKL